jgi:hypothetical protein
VFAAGTAQPTRRAGDTGGLQIASETGPGKLRVKLHWPSRFGALPTKILGALKADISIVDAYAMAPPRGRQGMEYLGDVNDEQLIADLEVGNIDVLLTYTYTRVVEYEDTPYNEVFTGSVQSALSFALGHGKLKKLMVW